MDDQDSGGLSPYYQQKADNFWNRFRYLAAQIWPYVMQLINFFLYTIFNIIRSTVKMIMEQVRIGG